MTRWHEIHFRQKRPVRASSCHECIAWPLCLIAEWLGSDHGAIEADHLDYYLDDVDFPIQSPPFAGSMA